MHFIPSRPIRASLLLAGLVLATLLAPANSNAFLVAAAGDISCPADVTAQNQIEPGEKPKPATVKCQGKQIAQMIASHNPTVALAVGDLIQGQPSVAGAYADFHEAWGYDLGGRIVSSLGNHDYHRDEKGRLTADGYFSYWQDQGAPEWRYGRPDDGWTSWNAGKWHFINLNSNCRAVDCTFTGPQLRWLIDDLKADRKNPATECTLAYFHHPLFSAGIPAGRSGDHMLVANLWELLYRYRTDLVVTGHQHFYERYLPQNPSGEPDPTGITQIISGTGGASTFHTDDDDGNRAANSEVAIRRLGATFLELGDGNYTTWFRDRLGVKQDLTGTRDCLHPNAGHELRAPRADRYAAHMKRMANLNRRINRLKRNIRKMTRKSAAKPRIRRAKAKRAKLVRTRGQIRNDRLY